MYREIDFGISNDCDRLAANPCDQGRRAAGVEYDAIKPDALLACAQEIVEKERDPRTQYQLARALEKEGIVEPTLLLYSEASKRGYGPATNNLANLVAQTGDVVGALRRYRLAWQQKYSPAAIGIGELLLVPDSQKDKLARALNWLNAGASAGLPVAHAELSGLYSQGILVPKDVRRALFHTIVAVQLYEQLGMQQAAEQMRIERGSLARSFEPAEVLRVAQEAADWSPTTAVTIDDSLDDLLEGEQKSSSNDGQPMTAEHFEQGLALGLALVGEWIIQDRSDFQSALVAYRAAATIARRASNSTANSDIKTILAGVLRKISDLDLRLGNIEDARVAFDEGIAYGPGIKIIVQRSGDKTEDELEKSKRLAEARVEADTNPGLASFMAPGNALRGIKKYSECAGAYTEGIHTLAEPKQEDWEIFYYRGICNERSHRFAEAESDFLEALKLKPDEPFVLNYLGYSWIDRGVHADEGLRMLKAAVSQRSNDGFIVDSLGWAYFRGSNYDEARRVLVVAVGLNPEDSLINEHLGDAYWMLGQPAEARFFWSRARDLGPEPENIPGIDSRLKNGLPDQASTLP